MPPVAPSEPVGLGKSVLELATPLLYRNNAFRVIGVSVDESTKDIARETRRAALLQGLGQTRVKRDTPLALSPSPDADAVRDAMQRLRDPERRFVEEFFWFWPQRFGESRTDEALIALASGSVQTATNLWSQRARTPQDAGVAIHNLAVLYHAIALDCEREHTNGDSSGTQKQRRDESWHFALDRWLAFLNQDSFWEPVLGRIRAIDDPRLTTDVARELRTVLPSAIVATAARLAITFAERGNGTEAARFIKLLEGSGFQGGVVRSTLRRVAHPVRDRVKLLCESAASDATNKPGNGAEVARRLLEHVLPTIAVLDRLFPTGDAVRDGAHDEAALRVEICLGGYAVETRDWKTVGELHEYARRLAASPSAREKVERNAETIKNNLIYGLCWFCKTNRPEDERAIQVPMHGNVTRTTELSGRTQIRWQHNTFHVPRCRECAAAHNRTRSLRTAGITLGSLAGLIGCAAMLNQSDEYFGVGLVLAALGAGAGGLLGWIIGRSKEPAKMAAMSTKTDFPQIQQMFKLGWSLGDRPS